MNRYLLPAIVLTGLITLGTAISAAYVVFRPEPKGPDERPTVRAAVQNRKPLAPFKP